MSKLAYVKKDLLTIGVVAVVLIAVMGALIVLESNSGTVSEWSTAFYSFLLRS